MQKRTYLIFLSLFLISILLFVFQDLYNRVTFNNETFGDIPQEYLVTRFRLYTPLYALFFTLSLLIPSGYTIYKLGDYPDWITPERRLWIRRLRLGLSLLFLYPVLETISSFQNWNLMSRPLRNYTSLPIFIYLLYLSIICFQFSATIIYWAIPEVDHWFFDEIKFRTIGELSSTKPNINYAEVWDMVDEMEKTAKSEKMNQNSLIQYLENAKKMVAEQYNI